MSGLIALCMPKHRRHGEGSFNSSRVRGRTEHPFHPHTEDNLPRQTLVFVVPHDLGLPLSSNWKERLPTVRHGMCRQPRIAAPSLFPHSLEEGVRTDTSSPTLLSLGHAGSCNPHQGGYPFMPEAPRIRGRKLQLSPCPMAPFSLDCLRGRAYTFQTLITSLYIKPRLRLRQAECFNIPPQPP